MTKEQVISEMYKQKIQRISEGQKIGTFFDNNENVEKTIIQQSLLQEQQIEQIKEVITGIRNVRTKMNVHPSKKSKLIFIAKPEYVNVIKESEGFIKKLGFSEEIEIKTEKTDIPQNAVNVVTQELEVFMPFEDLVDIAEEKERLEKEKQKILIEKEKTDKMLGNLGFLAKAPAAKVEEEKTKLEKFNEMLATIEQRINSLK